MTSRAVVLARGVGSRMRAPDARASLDPGQARAADAGVKAMFPINGRPLLDYALSELADAGLTEIALVVAPGHRAVSDYDGRQAPPARVRLSFVVQQAARGTADAVLAAEEWARGEPLVVVNADNVYPSRVLASLAALDEPGLPVFEAADLVRSSNIPADRIDSFALVEIDRHGYLASIVEKPAASVPRASPFAPRLVSMNCWRFDGRIFDACRQVRVSPRGEYELPGAVALALSEGVRFRTVRAPGPVLDLSRRADASELERRLAGTVPRP